MIDQNAAAERAEALLSHQPPISAEAALVGDPEDRGWCWLCYWTLATNVSGQTHEAPPPGTGPILVVKDSGEAHYLGSQSIEFELERAAEDLRRGP
ncbi:MAG TPA: hypothetical protein VNC23_06585 [Lapillicoccus sp.]|jgi:hypothetical protein|nr:hypothetical protein [Lapillicoccus sp.]